MNHHKTPSLHGLSSVMSSASARAAGALCMVVTAGCAHSPCTSFRAAWYLDDANVVAGAAASRATSAAPALSPTIFMALLNEGSEAIDIQRVVVNPTDSDSGGAEFNELARLMPGELRLFEVGNQLGKCRLPVAVQLVCGDGRSQTQAVSGSLPNYLHSTWIQSCHDKQAGSK